jgi:hypothetical protein
MKSLITNFFVRGLTMDPPGGGTRMALDNFINLEPKSYYIYIYIYVY